VPENEQRKETVRRFGAHQMAPKEQEVESEYLLGQSPYLEGKPKGDKSMVEKRGSLKRCRIVVPASPVCIVKLRLLNPSPTWCFAYPP